MDAIDDGEILSADLAKTRSGAYAARGFHFQDVVGAWLALNVAVGELGAAVVPEGLDDMTLVGNSLTNVQIKSRLARKGPWPAFDAAECVVDAWVANEGRTTRADEVWVVLENGLRDFDNDDPNKTLADLLGLDSKFGKRLKARFGERGLGHQWDRLLRKTSVLTPTMAVLLEESQLLAAKHTGLPPAPAGLIAHNVRIAIADAIDLNTTLDPTEVASLDRTKVIQLISAATELIDAEVLEEALRTGICSSLNWAPGADIGNSFYEGVSAQPMHVAAGLIVTRRDLLAAIGAAVSADQPVVITGPSGVGKSAVLWTVPLELPNVTWFRVHRLESFDDAALLMRLARAFGASTERQVGFLVDGAGTGRLTGWAELRELVSAAIGVVVVASARNEDVSVLGNLKDVATVAVALDEAAAETIYAGLRSMGATDAPHWREAFDQSNQLTLEYTHILTQGRRLGDVVGDQIAARIKEKREEELEVLAVVAFAGQWSIPIGSAQLASSLDVKTFAMRSAIVRLVDEHLISEQSGDLTGLHPLRSAAITTAIHEVTPPTIANTFRRALQTVDHHHLAILIHNALRAAPELHEIVSESALVDRDNVLRLAGHLHGLRLVDSAVQLDQWIGILDAHDIAPGLRPAVTLFALAGMDLGSLTPDRIAHVFEDLNAVPGGSARDHLANTVGAAHVVRSLFTADISAGITLLATLSGWNTPIEEPSDLTNTPLCMALAEADTDTLSFALATFQSHDVQLASRVVDALGGEAAMLERIRQTNPWLYELDVRQVDGERVAHARLLHLDDVRQGDARERCLTLARTLLNLLPEIDWPDVEALVPGRQRLVIGGHAMALSHLKRRFNRSVTEVAFNRTRGWMVQARLGVADSVRLAAAVGILGQLVDVVDEYAQRWIRQSLSQSRQRNLIAQCGALETAANQIGPTFGRTDFGQVVNAESVENDELLQNPVPAAVTEMKTLLAKLSNDTNWAGTGLYITDHATKTCQKLRNEPWHLTGQAREATRCIDKLIELLDELRRVVVARAADETKWSNIELVASRASTRSALRAAAVRADEVRAAALEHRRGTLENGLEILGLDVSFEVLAAEREGRSKFAILVHEASWLDWSEHAAAIVETVQAHNQTLDNYLILPIRNGYRLEAVGIQIIATPMPALDVGDWAADVPPAFVSEVQALVKQCDETLLFLSGLTELSEAQLEHGEVTELSDAANNELKLAFDVLNSVDDEFVQIAVGRIREIAQRVEEESDAGFVGETYASAVYRGILGEPTEEAQLTGAMAIVAAEWMIDPDGTADRLDW